MKSGLDDKPLFLQQRLLSEEIQLSFCAATENSTTKIVLFIAMALISVVKSDLW